VERLSKAFYLGSFLGAGILGWVLCAVGWFIWPLLIIAIPLLIYVAVVYYLLIYKAWESIQDGHARTGPCKAVGFLFIPFFNFYWIFVAHWGFAKDYNLYISRHRLDTASKLPEGLFLAYPILILVSLIPFVNIATSLAALIIFAVIIDRTCDAVNALPSASATQ
jgi:hypothetical protein